MRSYCEPRFFGDRSCRCIRACSPQGGNFRRIFHRTLNIDLDSDLMLARRRPKGQVLARTPYNRLIPSNLLFGVPDAYNFSSCELLSSILLETGISIASLILELMTSFSDPLTKILTGAVGPRYNSFAFDFLPPFSVWVPNQVSTLSRTISRRRYFR
jgi:hypothetical protein